MGLSFTVSEIKAIFAKFCRLPVYLTSLLRGSPWNFVMAQMLGLKTLVRCPYQIVKKCDISICLDTIPVLDRQMDRFAITMSCCVCIAC